jgi:hypothetical protein
LPRHWPDTLEIQKLMESKHMDIKKSHDKSGILIGS